MVRVRVSVRVRVRVRVNLECGEARRVPRHAERAHARRNPRGPRRALTVPRHVRDERRARGFLRRASTSLQPG